MLSLKREGIYFRRGGNSEGIWGYSSAGRAPALQAGGHRFEPDYLHQTFLKEGKKETWAHSSAG